MSLTRRELDAKLRDIENALRFLETKVPSLARDVAELRAQLMADAPPAEPEPEPEPEQAQLTTSSGQAAGGE